MIKAFLISLMMILGVVAHAQTAINRILVVVNEEAITQSDLDKRVALANLEARSSGQNAPPYGVLAPRLLEEMIVDRLLLEIARRSNLIVGEGQVDYALSVIAKQNQIGVNELKNVIEQSGVAFEDYRDDLKRQLTIRQVINARIGRTIAVSTTEVEEYLDQNPQTEAPEDRKVELAQIVCLVEADASTDERQRRKALALRIREELSAGLSFEEAADRYGPSDEVEVQVSLGMREAKQLPDVFLNALREVAEGGLTEVFETPRGWHILKVIRSQGGVSRMISQLELRHILMRQSALLSRQQVRSRLERARDRIISGEDFGAVAKLQSEDTTTRAAGGSLGWVESSALPPEFAQAIEGLSAGEVSPVFETVAGLHIAQVTGEREVDIAEDLRRREAEQVLRSRKSQEALEQWTQSLREEAYVQYRVTFDG